MDNNDSTITWGDSGGISNFLLNSIKLKSNFNNYLNEDGGYPTETQATTGRFYFFSVLWYNNDNYISIQNFLIDPITLKDKATQDKTTIVSAEDTTGPNNTKATPVETTHSMNYPNGLTNSSNGAYRYIIESGDIKMRDTYINQTKSIINTGSWVDIKTH